MNPLSLPPLVPPAGAQMNEIADGSFGRLWGGGGGGWGGPNKLIHQQTSDDVTCHL